MTAQTLAAYTANTSYPPYISVVREKGFVSIHVRGTGRNHEGFGDQTSVTLTNEDFGKLLSDMARNF